MDLCVHFLLIVKLYFTVSCVGQERLDEGRKDPNGTRLQKINKAIGIINFALPFLNFIDDTMI